MLIKKFAGATVPETLKKIRDELGEDALILDTKVAPRGDFHSLPDGNQVEITAAVDHHPLRSMPVRKRMGVQTTQTISKTKLIKSPEPTGQYSGQTQVGPISDSNETSDMAQSISRLKDEIESLIGQLGEKRILSNLCVDLKQLESKMEDRDFDWNITKEIIFKLNSQLSGGDEKSPEVIIRGVRGILQEMIPPSGDFPSKLNRPIKLVFVGPSGEGKTTCLEKLAYELSVRDERKVGIFGLDTDRIGAIPSLVSYARILGVGCTGIYNLPELKEGLEKYSNLDVILFDTKGTNPFEKSELKELSDWVSEVSADEVLLVLSATNRSRDLLEMAYGFLSLGRLKFLFTKLDQTRRYGGILSCAISTKRPICRVSWGAFVPEDLEKVDLEKMINMMF